MCPDTSGWYPNHPFGDICSVSVALDRSWNKRKKPTVNLTSWTRCVSVASQKYIYAVHESDSSNFSNLIRNTFFKQKNTIRAYTPEN